jgi:hypothetical protein
MSCILQIEFAADMLEAAVEVVSPDLSIVERIWLAPGQQKFVKVPSDASFLRIHLPSGDIVTLQDPGNLKRFITKTALMERLDRFRPRSEVSSGMRILSGSKRPKRGGSPSSSGLVGSTATELTLGGTLYVSLLSFQEVAQIGELRESGFSIAFNPPKQTTPYHLVLDSPGLKICVYIPGMIDELIVRLGAVSAEKRSVTVRVRTMSSTADAISAYMSGGDLYSAAVMIDWAEKAVDLLRHKERNPFAAAVGAYLLLRLYRFDLLCEWTMNLADWFPEVSDGNIIWGWQQIQQQGNEALIRDYFYRALNGPLPVFTEGLQLLGDGLRLLGEDGRKGVEKLSERSGTILWRSPFTATMHIRPSEQSSKIDIDIGYASQL